MNYEKMDTVFSRLKIISKLEPGEKIIFQDNSIDVVDFSTYNIGRVKKWYHDETRVSIRQKLKEFYRDIDDLVQNLMNNPLNYISKEDLHIVFDRLQRDLKDSQKGIRNLISTYNEDKTTRSELETVIERIQITLNKIGNHLKQEYPNTDTNTDTTKPIHAQTESSVDTVEPSVKSNNPFQNADTPKTEESSSKSRSKLASGPSATTTSAPANSTSTPNSTFEKKKRH